MRAEASTELEESSARASHRSTGPVSLRHLRSHSGLGTEQRGGRHNGGQTVEERKHLYTLSNFDLTGPSVPLLPQNALYMASSKDAHRYGAHGPDPLFEAASKIEVS